MKIFLNSCVSYAKRAIPALLFSLSPTLAAAQSNTVTVDGRFTKDRVNSPAELSCWRHIEVLIGDVSGDLLTDIETQLREFGITNDPECPFVLNLTYAPDTAFAFSLCNVASGERLCPTKTIWTHRVECKEALPKLVATGLLSTSAYDGARLTIGPIELCS